MIEKKKPRITNKSAKGKARRLQNQTVALLYEWYPDLKDGDIRPALMGETGCDVKLSPAGAAKIPFDIECKNQETAHIWEWLKQAEANSWEEHRVPLLVFTRNQSANYVCLKLEDFLELVEKY